MRRIKCCGAFWDSYMIEDCPRCNKRLGLSGSGAESCPGDAKRSGQDGVEERSREGGRVQSAASELLHIPQPKPAGLGRNADLTPFERSGRLDAELRDRHLKQPPPEKENVQ